MNNIRLHNIQYDRISGTFEARVDIEREGITYRYPCSIPGPENMDIVEVSSELQSLALCMSDTPLHLK